MLSFFLLYVLFLLRVMFIFKKTIFYFKHLGKFVIKRIKLQFFSITKQTKPAVKIAELLNVNHNTINDDIIYWHQRLTGEMNAQDITAKMTKQIQRIDIQRDRLLDDLEDDDTQSFNPCYDGFVFLTLQNSFCVILFSSPHLSF